MRRYVVGQHAVVVGGSVAGLSAAQARAGRFANVTVVERDALPDGPVYRRGVPQAAHVHSLLTAGLTSLDALFPGLPDELVDKGGVPMDAGRDVLFHQLGHYRLPYESSTRRITFSRPLLESVLRARVERHDNVVVRTSVAVDGLRMAGGRVNAVELSDGEVLPADLVVDASGRSSRRFARWLESSGFPTPPTSTVKVGVGYASRILRRRPDDLPHGKMVILSARAPVSKRFGVLFPIEDERWMLTLGGFHHDHPPDDDAGFAAYAHSLGTAVIGNVVDRAEPLAPIVTHQFPASIRRHFERQRRLPGGYVAIGDAICSFNPVYGQGMSVAALEAQALGRCLDRVGAPSARMARAYYRAAARPVRLAWWMAGSVDFLFPETSGPKPVGADLVNRYLRQVVLASHVNVDVHRVLLEVSHLVRRPAALAHPSTVVATYRWARRSPVVAGAPAPAA
jgi:2-polyprenyl-6-methoxyphenol hydroxylase-like FAD-dependent oxidoreductase